LSVISLTVLLTGTIVITQIVLQNKFWHTLSEQPKLINGLAKKWNIREG